MNLEQLMVQVRIDRTVKGIRRRTWPVTRLVIPGRGTESDSLVIQGDSGGSSTITKYEPNLFDLFSPDWEAIR